MSNYAMNKRELTEFFINLSGGDLSKKNVDAKMLEWWIAPFSPRGFQLSFKGFYHLSVELDFTKYEFTLQSDFDITPSIIILMSKHIKYPFYIPNNLATITLFGSEDATMIGLYNGDLKRYLENYTRV